MAPWERRSRRSLQPGSKNKALSLPLWWFSQYRGKEIPSETRASEHVLFPEAFGHVYSPQWDTGEE